MSTGLFKNSPRTAYLKAIDIFLLVCFLFSVAVFVEFCTVLYAHPQKPKIGQAGTADIGCRIGDGGQNRAIQDSVFVVFLILFFSLVYGVVEPVELIAVRDLVPMDTKIRPLLIYVVDSKPLVLHSSTTVGSI